MPSAITHELIADQAKELLPAAKQAAAFAPDYYFLGAQGPDLFFFYRPLSRKEYNLGKTLHRGKVYAWYNALLHALDGFSGEEYQKCLAYALGFCTHLAADTAFHPFVYAYLKENGCKKKVHQIMENDWDVYFLREMRGKEVVKYPFPFSPRKMIQENVLFRYISSCAKELERKPLKKGAFGRMLRFYGWYLKHFHRAHGRYLRPLGQGYLYPRTTPAEEFLEGKAYEKRPEGRSADDLFGYAVRGSAERMEAFLSALEGKPLPAPLFSRHMLTGELLPER